MAQALRGLVTDQHDAAARIVDMPFQMTDDAARFAHAARSDKNARLGLAA